MHTPSAHAFFNADIMSVRTTNDNLTRLIKAFASTWSEDNLTFEKHEVLYEKLC